MCSKYKLTPKNRIFGIARILHKTRVSPYDYCMETVENTAVEEHKAPVRKVGRPRKDSLKTRMTICARLANGESLSAICRDKGMPDRGTVVRWCLESDEFYSEYSRARAMQAELFAHEIIELTDSVLGERQSSAAVTAAKNASDARKWVISKILPSKYGDKLQVEHSGSMGLELAVSRPPALNREQWIATHSPKQLDAQTGGSVPQGGSEKEGVAVEATLVSDKVIVPS